MRLRLIMSCRHNERRGQRESTERYFSSRLVERERKIILGLATVLEDCEIL